MWRGEPLDSNSLRSLSSELEDSGYHSVLLPFHSESPDYLIKSAAALIPGDKLKYMIALRPYHVSPQFCAMITEGYNQIEKERLTFNWIAGDFHNRDDEPRQFDVFGETESIDSITKRTTFLRNFIEQYKSFGFVSSKPEMVFSGFSEYTLETVKIFNGTSLCMIDDYRKNIKRFKDIVNRMVCVAVVVLESNDQIKEYKEKIYSVNPRSVDTTIVGDKQTVKEKLFQLKSEGITDILLDTQRPEFIGISNKISKNNYTVVNNLVKEIQKEIENV
jgi:hypothetical protein